MSYSNRFAELQEGRIPDGDPNIVSYSASTKAGGIEIQSLFRTPKTPLLAQYVTTLNIGIRLNFSTIKF
jgi:hypothetical protein